MSQSSDEDFKVDIDNLDLSDSEDHQSSPSAEEINSQRDLSYSYDAAPKRDSHLEMSDTDDQTPGDEYYPSNDKQQTRGTNDRQVSGYYQSEEEAHQSEEEAHRSEEEAHQSEEETHRSVSGFEAEQLVLDSSESVAIEDNEGSKEFEDQHIELFFDDVVLSDLAIPEYIDEDYDIHSNNSLATPDVEIIESLEDIVVGVETNEMQEKIYDSQLIESGSLDLKDLDLEEVMSDKDAAEEIPRAQGEEEDFLANFEPNQELYDQFGNLLQKPKSIFTTLDRFYVRPLSYLNLDIINSAHYTTNSHKLDEALAFLNSPKCKALLTEVEPPESSGLYTVNVKDPAVNHSIIPPKSRKEYKNYRTQRYPWFMWGLTAVQAVLVIVSFILNFNYTEGIIQTTPFNPMIGPNPGIMITLGARYVPCMKYTPANWNDLSCPAGVKVRPSPNETCTLADICKSSSNTNPDQGWRFLAPTFLHSGVVHFVVNGFFQLRVATVFEKEIGALKTAIVFFVSSVGGYIFGGAFSVSANDTPSVGSSGGLFGIIACLTTDIFANWNLLKNPRWEASKTLLNIVVAFVMGWLPGVDNFSHIGGYIVGLILAPIIMTNSYISKEDRQRKKILQYLSLPLLVLFFAMCLYGFYKFEVNCPACQYLNCVPGLPWCKQKGVDFG